jgi:serine protease Do
MTTHSHKEQLRWLSLVNLEVIVARPLVGIIVITLAGCWPSVSAAENARSLREVFKQVDPSVVVVETNSHRVVTGPRMQLATLPGLGSGVLISEDGKVMTAAHVVQTADEIKVQFKNGAVSTATVLMSDAAADVALLQLAQVPAGAVVARLGDSDETEVGDEVFVVGAPLGMSHTLTVGHISARRILNTMFGDMSRSEFFQTDAAINQGNSGGPMFNLEGQLVGVVSHIMSKSGGSEGLGFAVTSNLARRLLLHQNQFWSGVETVMLSGDLARVFNLPQNAGLLVQRVASNSPAAQLGLKPGTMAAVIEGDPMIVGGDIVLEVQDVPVTDDGAGYLVIRDRLTRLRLGDTITVIVWRHGRKETLTAKRP